jgi:hypothetical protein
MLGTGGDAGSTFGRVYVLCVHPDGGMLVPASKPPLTQPACANGAASNAAATPHLTYAAPLPLGSHLRTAVRRFCIALVMFIDTPWFSLFA